MAPINFIFKNYGKNLVVTVPLGVSKPFKNFARFPLFIDFLVSFGVKNLKPLKVSFISPTFISDSLDIAFKSLFPFLYLSLASCDNSTKDFTIPGFSFINLFVTETISIPMIPPALASSTVKSLVPTEVADLIELPPNKQAITTSPLTKAAAPSSGSIAIMFIFFLSAPTIFILSVKTYSAIVPRGTATFLPSSSEALAFVIPDLLEVRGEIFIKKPDFDTLNLKAQKNDEKVFANPRNAAAGSLRQLDPAVTSSRPLAFYAHGIGLCKGKEFVNLQEIFSVFSSWGLPVNNLNKLATSIDECFQYFKDIASSRSAISFEIDGVVFKVNELSIQKQLGEIARSPRWAIAHKFPAEEAHTEIENIDFQVGRTGILTPVAKLKTVNVGGVNVSNCTLHNLDELKRLDPRVGDGAVIKRAGDVIPKMVRVIPKKKNRANAVEAPQKCQSCFSDVVFNYQSEWTNMDTDKSKPVKKFASIYEAQK